MGTRRIALSMTATCALVLASACSQEAGDAANTGTGAAGGDAGAEATRTADAGEWSLPMTEWGEPDLRGTWPVGHLTGTPLRRPAEFGDREFLTDEEYAEREGRIEAAAQRYENEDNEDRMGMGHWAETGEANRRTSLIISPASGQLPAFTPAGTELSNAMRSSWRQGQAFDWTTDFDSWDRCITRGMPASMFPFQYNNGMRIFQAPGVVAINMEMVHETRLIPTDGRAALPAQISNWMGESRGHWEGDTLVVETTNLKPGPSVTNIGTTGSPPWNDTPVTETAKIVERFRMTGPDTIEYEMTYEDPAVFVEPWTAHLDWQRDDAYGMFEYACHEANYMIRDYISADRAGRDQASAE